MNWLTQQHSNISISQANQNRRRFNRSLTEVRPDAYIFDDGAHFEVRTVEEEDEERLEVPESHETLNEQQQQKPNLRKASLMSEDSDIFIPDKTYSGTTIPGPVETKPPYISIQTRQETTSTESKDTLTPIEPNAGQAAEADEEEDDVSTENIMELNFETARQKAMRRRSMGMGRRLSSECCSNYDLNRSQTSLNATLAMSRRQLSLTQSEPDSGNELPGNFRFNFALWFPFNCLRFFLSYSSKRSAISTVLLFTNHIIFFTF